MRQAKIEIVESYVRGLLRTNLRQGRDKPSGFDYSYLCPSPDTYRGQVFWNSCFHAIAIAHLDPQQAQAELRTLVAGQEEDGFIGHTQFWGVPLWGLLQMARFSQTPVGERLRRTGLMQPPMLAQAVERVAEITNDPAFPPEMMDALDLHHSWLATRRAPGEDCLVVTLSPHENGLAQTPAYDSYLNLPSRPSRWRAAQKDRWTEVRNWLATYDSARMLRAGHFYVKDVLVNVLYADSLETMSRLHRKQGNAATANAYAGLSTKVQESLFSKMFDLSRGAFFSLAGKEEVRTEPLTISSLVPLALRTLPRAIATQLVGAHLTNMAEFWLRHPLPSIAANEHSYMPQGSNLSVSRGFTSVPLNWLLWRGLNHHGFTEIASQLAESTVQMVADEGLREFYDADTGDGAGARSFGWSALALDMTR